MEENNITQKANNIISVLSEQRNSALNQLAILQAEFNILQEKNKKLTEELDKLASDKKEDNSESV